MQTECNKREHKPFVHYSIQLPWYWRMYDVARTVLLCLLLIPLIRVLIFVIFFLLFYLYCRLVTIGADTTHLGPKRVWWLNGGVKVVARLFLWVFGIIVRVDGAFRSDAKLIVSNHVSYLDALVLMAITPRGPSFAAHGGLRKVPILGFLCRVAVQCIFVDGRRSAVTQDVESPPPQPSRTIKAIRERLQALGPDGNPVLMYPEGTTTNGHWLGAFYPGAFVLQTPMQIVCLDYPNKFFSLSWEDPGIAWRIFRLLTQCVHNVDCKYIHEIYQPSGNVETDRDAVQDIMSQGLDSRPLVNNYEYQKPIAWKLEHERGEHCQ